MHVKKLLVKYGSSLDKITANAEYAETLSILKYHANTNPEEHMETASLEEGMLWDSA